MPNYPNIRTISASILVLLAISPSQAQLVDSTFVSRNGNDSSSFCTASDPCRTFQHAHDMTDAGGVINVLDAGQFGSIAITKSITINGLGRETHILFSPAVVVDAGPDDVVALHGLSFQGVGAIPTAVILNSGGQLHLGDCLVRDFQGAGTAIELRPTTFSRIFISDCTLSNNKRGILARPVGGGAATVFLDNVVVERSTGYGIRADGSQARIRLNGTTVTNNGVGLQVRNGGRLISFGNNAIAGNKADGDPTDVISLK